MQRSPLSRRQRWVHVGALSAGWLLFFAGWVMVAQDPDAQFGAEKLSYLILGSALAFPLGTFLWVRHNVGIYVRKGPRRTSANPTLDYSHDWHGLPVSADWPDMQAAPHVVVSIRDGVKCFERPPVGGREH